MHKSQNCKFNSLISENFILSSSLSFTYSFPSYLSAVLSKTFNIIPQNQDNIQKIIPTISGQKIVFEELYTAGNTKEPKTLPNLAIDIFNPIARDNSLPINH